MNLLEIKRRELLQKSRFQSPARFARRLNYKPKIMTNINLHRLLDEDVVECYIPIGDYVCTIVFGYVIENIVMELNTMTNPKIDLQLVIRSLSRAYDESDILVNCSCPDYKYRFQYWASKYGYQAGQYQVVATKITNPKDSIGSVCKHLLALLNNKTWLVKVASVVNNFFRSHPKEAYDKIFQYVETYNEDDEVYDEEELPNDEEVMISDESDNEV